ncbi:HalOD1 output domain-containing protein [Halorussus aquaticus]|nr:HalOD1 output domain-containing protein [Halorussus aquaticus]
MTNSTGTASATSHTTTNNDGTTYCVQEGESVTEAVVRAVSAEKDSRPAELESLYSVIETDALNALFGPQLSGNRRMANGAVAFEYSGCEIRVTHDGEVLLRESGGE